MPNHRDKPWRVYQLDFGRGQHDQDIRPFIVARIFEGRIEMYTDCPGWPQWWHREEGARTQACYLNSLQNGTLDDG